MYSEGCDRLPRITGTIIRRKGRTVALKADMQAFVLDSRQKHGGNDAGGLWSLYSAELYFI
jgi:hypothetical protein